jgi:hypothetical protein
MLAGSLSRCLNLGFWAGRQRGVGGTGLLLGRALVSYVVPDLDDRDTVNEI